MRYSRLSCGPTTARPWSPLAEHRPSESIPRESRPFGSRINRLNRQRPNFPTRLRVAALGGPLSSPSLAVTFTRSPIRYPVRRTALRGGPPGVSVPWPTGRPARCPMGRCSSTHLPSGSVPQTSVPLGAQAVRVSTPSSLDPVYGPKAV